MFNNRFKMDDEDVILYVKEKLDFFSEGCELKVKEIGDGNINYVFRVWDEKSKKSIIIKQADTLLRTSGRPLDLDRIRIEAETLMLHNKLVPQLTPIVYMYDPIMKTIAMEDLGDHQNLRKALLQRKSFPRLADDMSTFVVDALLPTTDIAMDSGCKKGNVIRYINKDLCKISEDLVFTEPYINYKNRNIILDENLSFVKRQLYEDKDLTLQAGILKNTFMNKGQALIHGDLHSGSIFVTEKSTKILDPEFAFYGPIGYDLGNVIGNLFFPLVHSYVTEEEKEARYFNDWIINTIEDTIELFKIKFVKLYREIVTDVMFKDEGYMQWYLHSILSDTAGMAGLEMIRRVVGDAKVEDVTGITEVHRRVKAERILIKTAKAFIMNRDSIVKGKNYIQYFTEVLHSFL